MTEDPTKSGNDRYHIEFVDKDQKEKEARNLWQAIQKKVTGYGKKDQPDHVPSLEELTQSCVGQNDEWRSDAKKFWNYLRNVAPNDQEIIDSAKELYEMGGDGKVRRVEGSPVIVTKIPDFVSEPCKALAVEMQKIKALSQDLRALGDMRTLGDQVQTASLAADEFDLASKYIQSGLLDSARYRIAVDTDDRYEQYEVMTAAVVVGFVVAPYAFGAEAIATSYVFQPAAEFALFHGGSMIFGELTEKPGEYSRVSMQKNELYKSLAMGPAMRILPAFLGPGKYGLGLSRGAAGIIGSGVGAAGSDFLMDTIVYGKDPRTAAYNDVWSGVTMAGLQFRLKMPYRYLQSNLARYLYAAGHMATYDVAMGTAREGLDRTILNPDVDDVLFEAALNGKEGVNAPSWGKTLGYVQAQCVDVCVHGRTSWTS